ncbi:MAG: (2Fe-2S)-binding protein [Chloroflexota bacterium]|nr:(2Fe-2S)-binding protein [Chloroflexota bacterium]
MMVQDTTNNSRLIKLTVNGVLYERKVEPRVTLVDFIRGELGITGTHVGCEHGVCGACTVIFDGQPIRSCIMLAVQADSHSVQTVEGMSSGEQLHPIQQAFWENFGLQCGFCTPGFLLTVQDLLSRNPDPTDTEIREELSGNICRCTGYQSIIAAVKQAAIYMRQE